MFEKGLKADGPLGTHDVRASVIENGPGPTRR
jgi:hypothetical protein